MQFRTAALAVLTLAACSQPAPTPEGPAERPIPVAAPSGEYTLDPNHSTVTVSALRFGLANYVLRFNAVSGSLNFNAEDPGQSTVEASVAVTSLDTPYSGARDFDAELQNSDWLDAATHPTATFRSTQVERTGPNSARVTGDLTLRGVTRPITLDVTYNGSYAQHPVGLPEAGVGFSARGSIPRSQFGINSMRETPGAHDGVADAVNLQIEAVFSRSLGEPMTRQPAEPVN
jgi:polyisoprenoid-binding protein YceI